MDTFGKVERALDRIELSFERIEFLSNRKLTRESKEKVVFALHLLGYIIGESEHNPLYIIQSKGDGK